MNSKFRQKYKVDRSAVQEAFENQMCLKRNEEYEEWADYVGVQLIKYFLKQYKGVKIEIPKIREKSPKSLLGKIKNLQIERLSKLYAIEGISDIEKEDLYKRLEERICEINILNTEQVLDQIISLLYDKIEEIDIDKLEKMIMIDEISKSTKTACLRILFSKIENSTLVNKSELLEKLDKKYGEKAAIESGIEEDDIIRYSSIKNIKADKDKINRLKEENRFLKANDLRGMKIIIVDIPEDFKTENEKIKYILDRRKNEKDDIKKTMLTHYAIVELGKEFYAKLENDKGIVKELNLEVIPGSNKHKKKANGYEAEHVKFMSKDEPQYTLELQFKSEHVENICRGEGSASHENRPGKARILPQFSNDEELIKKLEFMTPKYKIFKLENGEIKVQKFNTLQNIMGYFQGKLEPGSYEFEKVIQLYSKKENKEITI